MGRQHIQLLRVKGNSRGVLLPYVTRKDTSSPEDSKNRDVQIIHQASIFGKCLPETQGKLLILSRNCPLEMTLRHGLKVSSVVERQCRNFIPTIKEHHKYHVGIKFIEQT